MAITYNPATNFTAKDEMGTANPDKVLSGVPFDFEFNAISAAFQQVPPSFNPIFTGTLTADAIVANTVNGSDTANWDTAYSWGDHSLEGYLTSYTETDPVFSASEAATFVSGDKSNLDTVTAWNTAHGSKTTNWDYAFATINDKESIWDSKIGDAPADNSQYARVNGDWAVVQAGASSALTQEQIDGFDDASEWVEDNGARVTQWDAAYAYGDHNSAGYSTDDPAIIDSNGTPVLASGVTAAEIRSLIGAGTASFSGSYDDLTDKPTIPTNNNQLTNGRGFTTYTGSDAVKKTGNETIAGTKTFQNTISGSISGNAATATTATTAATATSATTAGTATNCSRSVVAGTGLTGGGALTSNATLSLNPNVSVTTVTATGLIQGSGGLFNNTVSASSFTTGGAVEAASVKIGNFTVQLDGASSLRISHSTGGDLFRVDSSGNLIVKGNVTAYGAP